MTLRVTYLLFHVRLYKVLQDADIGALVSLWYGFKNIIIFRLAALLSACRQKLLNMRRYNVFSICQLEKELIPEKENQLRLNFT